MPNRRKPCDGEEKAMSTWFDNQRRSASGRELQRRIKALLTSPEQAEESAAGPPDEQRTELFAYGDWLMLSSNEERVAFFERWISSGHPLPSRKNPRDEAERAMSE